ncbi:hypothetical protein [Flavobacterium notoginsengisoli]|uniref:hypothetical protein n=1 Tax=Flavobacterium notoginsengisoli TaxID=1478199 RepID=UPI00362CEB61
MKNLKAPFLAFALILLNISIVTANENPNNPPPPDMGTNDAGNGGLEEGPGGGLRMAIDQNIMILFIGGLALGATVIYRKQIKKASN